MCACIFGLGWFNFFSKTQKGIKTDGFQNGKFLIFKPGIMARVYFGTRFGCLFSSTQRGIKTDAYQMASCLIVKKLTFWYLFVLVPVWVLLISAVAQQ